MVIPSVRQVSGVRILRYVLRGLLLAWAGFWTWFVLSATIGDPGPVPWWIPVAWLSSLCVAVVVPWRWPILGGLALVASGSWAATYFANSSARALLAAPAIGLKIAFCLLGWCTRAQRTPHQLTAA